MSLATRCSACGTVFRVVQDQLRVSGGWVRCGRCAEVFNAIESLVDLELDRPGEDSAPSVHGSKIMDELAQVTQPTPPVEPAPEVSETPYAAAFELPQPQPGEPVEPEPLPQALEDTPIEDDPVIVTEPPPAPSPLSRPRPKRATPPDNPASIARDLRGEPIVAVTPDFLRQAERAARWRRPTVRIALSLLGIAAAVLLTAQSLIAWHDLAAARWPALTPAIAQLCHWEGCRIEPPRRIDSLTVDSSGLVRTGSADTYGLALVMRNRDSSMALRLPSIDLALTDALGQTLARRVIHPAALGITLPSIAAGSELGMAGLLRIDAGSVAGYTIELFYP